MMGNIASTKFLIEVGTNIFLETPYQGYGLYLFFATYTESDFVSRSPEKIAWDLILVNAVSLEWRELFPDTDFDELYEFSPLHKSVLGLSSCSLESIIHAEPNCINQTDRYGKTALFWAVHLGDSEATRTLLSHGSDCNKADNIGKTPL